MTINILPFSKVLTDVTKKFTKIKKQDYLENGKYAIIDQGKDFICGYTDNENTVNFEDIPLIIFGDHTKVFKYIDFPIAIGADGVKALTINSSIAETKYIYYYLKSLRLHDAGYSRHFKYLKAKRISLPEDIDDQIKIANLLSQVEALIAKREESIKLLDELLRSTFLDMFGDPAFYKKNWAVKKLEDHLKSIVDIGSNGSNANISKNLNMNDDENYALMIRTVNLNSNDFKKNVKYISEKTYNYFKKSKVYGGEIIMNKIGSAGKFWIMPNLNRPVSLGLNQLMLKLDNLNTQYLYYYLSTDYMQQIIKTSTKGAVTKSITKGAVKKLPLLYPPKPLQDKFATIVQQVEESKKRYQESLNELNELFGSLSQRAFKGELDLPKDTKKEIIIKINGKEINLKKDKEQLRNISSSFINSYKKEIERMQNAYNNMGINNKSLYGISLDRSIFDLKKQYEPFLNSSITSIYNSHTKDLMKRINDFKFSTLSQLSSDNISKALNTKHSYNTTLKQLEMIKPLPSLSESYKFSNSINSYKNEIENIRKLLSISDINRDIFDLKKQYEPILNSSITSIYNSHTKDLMKRINDFKFKTLSQLTSDYISKSLHTKHSYNTALKQLEIIKPLSSLGENYKALINNYSNRISNFTFILESIPKLTDIIDDELFDDVYLSATYDNIKELVFRLIRDGKLKQVFDVKLKTLIIQKANDETN